MTPNEVLLKAAEYIGEHGWIQQDLSNEHGYCAQGAIYSVCGVLSGSSTYMGRDVDAVRALEALRLLENYLLPLDRRWTSVTQWNDDPSRTAEDVILTMKRAAEG